MSIRLNLDRVLEGSNIPPEDIRPDIATRLGRSVFGRLTATIGNELLQGFGAPERIRPTPNLEDPRSYEIFQRAKADFDAARPTVDRILYVTKALRGATLLLNKDIEFQNSLYVQIGKCALECISAAALGLGFHLMQTTPLLSAEGGTIAAGTIAGAALPQAIKYRFLPDLTASIQANRARIENYRGTLNGLWVELEGDNPGYPPEDLLQAGSNLQRQLDVNSQTYNHLERRFRVPNPAPMPSIEAARAE